MAQFAARSGQDLRMITFYTHSEELHSCRIDLSMAGLKSRALRIRCGPTMWIPRPPLLTFRASTLTPTMERKPKQLIKAWDSISMDKWTVGPATMWHGLVTTHICCLA